MAVTDNIFRWSSDDVAGTSESPSPPQTRDTNKAPKVLSTVRKTSNDEVRTHKSQRSIESIRSSDTHASVSPRGISLGHSKATAAEGIVSRESTAAQVLRVVGESTTDNDSGSKKLKKRR